VATQLLHKEHILLVNGRQTDKDKELRPRPFIFRPSRSQTLSRPRPRFFVLEDEDSKGHAVSARVQDQGFLEEFFELHNLSPPSPPLIFPSPTLPFYTFSLPIFSFSTFLSSRFPFPHSSPPLDHPSPTGRQTACGTCWAKKSSSGDSHFDCTPIYDECFHKN